MTAGLTYAALARLGRKLSAYRPRPGPYRIPQAPAQPGHALTELPGVGKATECQLSAARGPHPALRFVWHHILPQACGGKTEKANLAELCDTCHYTVHALMWLMANGGVPTAVHERVSSRQWHLATVGYQLAVAAGTAGKMPKETAAG